MFQEVLNLLRWAIALGNQSGATTSSGGLASNYNLTSAALTINQKVLNSNSSGYNATTAAAASDIILQTKYQVKPCN